MALKRDRNPPDGFETLVGRSLAAAAPSDDEPAADLVPSAAELAKLAELAAETSWPEEGAKRRGMRAPAEALASEPSKVALSSSIPLCWWCWFWSVEMVLKVKEAGEMSELGLKRIRYCEAAPKTSNIVDNGDADAD